MLYFFSGFLFSFSFLVLFYFPFSLSPFNLQCYKSFSQVYITLYIQDGKGGFAMLCYAMLSWFKLAGTHMHTHTHEIKTKLYGFWISLTIHTLLKFAYILVYINLFDKYLHFEPRFCQRSSVGLACHLCRAGSSLPLPRCDVM